MALVTPAPLDDLVLDLAARATAADSTALDDLDRLVHLARLPGRGARTAPLERPLPPEVEARLGVDELWSHQADAIDLLRAGRSVALATGTASGKSLVYQAAIGEAAATPLRSGTALLLFPTRALGQDQWRSLARRDFPGVVPATYDGDTDHEERARVRRHATAVLTNPEMLHSGILPHHPRWAVFLRRLRYVVVDEMHVFRGVFGSHVAHLLRRLRRLCHHYGSDPVFCFTSATIGQPGRLAEALCGLPVAEVTDDGSPRGERLVAIWSPPLLDAATGRRASAHGETAGLVAGLVRGGQRTLAFCRSRRATELVAADAARRAGAPARERIRPYRGGYLTSERREVEDALAAGRLDGVVTTTALELGVDIDGVDAVVLDGFPGTIASFWQQIGRAGRSQRSSLAVLVAGADQLDRWFVHHPEELVSRVPEPAVVNPANPFVLDPHLRCAAFERPLVPADERYWPGLLDEAVRRLVHADDLEVCRRARGPVGIWSGVGWPAHGVGLRSSGGGEVRIVDLDDGPVGTVDVARAAEMVHPGAFYLHRGRGWRVVELDLAHRRAVVRPDEGGEYTVARSTTELSLLTEERSTTLGGATLHLGAVEVTRQVVGFQRKETGSGQHLGVEPLDLPPSTLTTRAFWYTLDAALLRRAGVGSEPAGALHAAEHAAIGVLPLFTICDRWDVGGISTPHLADTGAPTIVVYDGYPGGAGIAELGFEAGSRLLAAALASIDACGCRDGCPSCVQSPKCGNGNEPLDKVGAAAILRAVLGTA